MFWRKCGKLMINPDGNLSNCPECPCGYYGLFVLVYYLHDISDRPGVTDIYRCPGDPKLDWLYKDFCSQQMAVFPAHVVDNELKPYQYLYYGPNIMGFDKYTCIPVSRQAQPDGTVAGDQELEGQYYMLCDYTSNPPVYGKIDYLVHVYRIGDCYDNYDDFAAFFYFQCGVLPDASGKFPDIFTTVNFDGVWYEVTSSDAMRCAMNNWYLYAQKLYRPNCVVHLINHTFSYNLYPQYEITKGGGNPDDGGFGSTYGMRIINRYCGDDPENPGGEYTIDYEIGTEHWCPGCNSPWGGWTFTCCNWWDGSIPALEDVNEWDAEAVDDDTKYCVTQSDTGGDNITNIPNNNGQLCVSGTTEAYYGAYTMSPNFRWRQRQYCVLLIEKTNNTPEGATGVVCCVKAYFQKTNDEYCIEKNTTENIYDNDFVTFKFDTEYRFDTCDNMKPWVFLNERSDCAETCVDNAANGDNPDVGPHGWHNNTEFFYTYFAVVRYSYD